MTYLRESFCYQMWLTLLSVYDQSILHRCLVRLGAWCNAHPQQAGEIAAQWIGLPPEAGRKSSLVFLGSFSDSWLRGADTYLRILDSMNKFSGSLRHKTMEQARPLLLDESFLDSGK